MANPHGDRQFATAIVLIAAIFLASYAVVRFGYYIQNPGEWDAVVDRIKLVD